MASKLQKTMLYLGLATNDAYEADDEEYYDDEHYSESESRREVDDRPAPVTSISGGKRVARVIPVNDDTELQRIVTVHPRAYHDAKTIGENFRNGVPVIVNLSDMDDADAKRLIDFAAGLVFGLRGTLERVTTKVFLLSPAHVEIQDSSDSALPDNAARSGMYSHN